MPLDGVVVNLQRRIEFEVRILVQEARGEDAGPAQREHDQLRAALDVHIAQARSINEKLTGIPRLIAEGVSHLSARLDHTEDLQARLDLDGTGPKVGDVFILLLVARDRAVAGQIEEIAIGVINSGYEQYLHYETLPSYLQGHADESVTPGPTPLAPTSTVIQLKPKITPFVPPEKQDGDKPSEGEAESV